MPGLTTAKEIREQRARLANEANAILTAAKDEARGLSAEDQAKFDAIHDQIDALGKQAVSIERHESVMREMEQPRPLIAGGQDVRTVSADESQEIRAREDAAFSAYLRNGLEGLDAEQRTIIAARHTRDGLNAVNTRAAQTVTTTGGGYLIPQGFSNQLEESLKLWGNVEAACDVFETESGNTLPWPTVDDTAQSGELLAINTAVTEQAVTYGVVNFGAYKFSSKMVTVPVELLQDSAFNVDAHLASVLGTRIGRTHNSYQTTGTGSSQPKGIVTGASSGVTAASATAVTYDELLDLEHSVDPAYRNAAFGAGWMFNDGTLKKLRQLKDGDGRPLWQAGTTGGAPDTINGYPYWINQDMAAMTTGNKPILFGALKKFKVRKVKAFTLLRLTERYADLHQVAFLAFTRMDSNMLDAGTDPVKYITMA